jgi:hypothetical protein
MSKPSNEYRAWQEGSANDTKNGGPWFVTVPDGGDIEIGYDANGKPDEYHARLFASAAALVDAVETACEYLESEDDFRPAVRLREKFLALLDAVGKSHDPA